MAAAGFYRKHNAPYPDVADCRVCGLWLDDWRPDDVPLSEHSRRSPDWPFITKQQNLQELVKLKISKSSPVLSAQPLSSTAQPKKRSLIDEFPSKPARKKYPKSQLRQTAVTSPIPKPRHFDNWLYRTKGRFFEILDEAGKLACYPYHDLSHMDPEDIFKVNYSETEALPKTLTGDMGVPLPVICVARKGLTYRGSNTKAAIPSSNEYDGPYDWKKEATSFKSDKYQGQGMKQMCNVDLGSGDEDWEKVGGLGEEDEWTNFEKGDLA